MDLCLSATPSQPVPLSRLSSDTTTIHPDTQAKFQETLLILPLPSLSIEVESDFH
jgi:hypothetical protein